MTMNERSAGEVIEMARAESKMVNLALVESLLDLDVFTAGALNELASPEELYRMCTVIDAHLAATSSPDLYLDHARSWARAVVIYGAALADGETDNVPPAVTAALFITTTCGRPPREAFPREHLSSSPSDGADFLLSTPAAQRRAAAVGTYASRRSWWVPVQLVRWVREG